MKFIPNGTGKFRFWCQKVLPLVYDDSLSYYEVLCKLTKFVNDLAERIADAFEEINTNVQEYVNQWLDDHPEATTTVQDGAITIPKLAEDTLEEIHTAKWLTGRTLILDDDDLNNYTEIGEYYFERFQAYFAYIFHAPTREVENQMWRMTVEYTNPDNTDDEIMQTVTCERGYPVYRRYKRNNSWSDWITVQKKEDAYCVAPVDENTMSAMVDLMEGYCAQAFTPDGEDSKLIYEGSLGLYTNNLGTYSAQGIFSICCAQFVDAVINGITWDNSRYNLGLMFKNSRLPWGYQFDNQVSFQSAVIDATRNQERYLTASRIAEYGAVHGFLVKNDGVFQPMPGDIFCRTEGSEDPESYMYEGIGHVGIVLSSDSVLNGNGKINVIESWDTVKYDNDNTVHDCGIRFMRYDLNQISHFIRFPVGGAGGGNTRLLKTVTEFPTFATNTILYNADATDRTELFNEKGFYTVKVRFSDFPANSAPHNITVAYRYPDATRSRTFQLSRYGCEYYGVLYLERPIGDVFQIYSDDNDKSATPKDVKIYRGFKSL